MSTQPRFRITLIEDDPIMGETLQDRFTLEGFDLDWFTTGREALEAIGEADHAAIICDIRLPDMNGTQILDQLNRDDSGSATPPVLFITGYGTIDEAVDLLKQGATDYITKPFEIDELVHRVRSLCGDSKEPCPARRGEPVLGRSPVMRHLQESIPRIAQYRSPVLITGESGVGKDHVAGFLHACTDPEQRHPFLTVNCGAIPAELLESELFGHEKGAFTGAHRTRQGLFERAGGGTLFLDEIAETPLDMQVKLLRVVQSQEFYRVGGETSLQTDAWLIFATNRDLSRMVEEGSFREDLFYRINVVQLRVPPLRERREDILWFAHRFLREFADQHPDEEMRYLLPSAERALQEHGWPGNLRELKHCIHRACILTPERALGAEALGIGERAEGSSTGMQPKPGGTLKEQLQEFERAVLEDALAANDHQVQATADALGISRKNLWEKLKKAGLRD